ncbi:MAG: thiol:disulfide interchange protein DsbA/DsbL [Gammaproteobacteria bacterium]|nr:thiol:disulfide interchange protein DsbA/DsbL [Gammaproteobacteria bacterium]
MWQLFRSSLILITLVSLLSPAMARELDEGIEYKRLKSPVPVQTPGKVEVVEMFWYGCPHCFHLEPDIKAWLDRKPDNVEFIRIPAVFRPVWELHAKVYYTAEFLGVMDKIHEPFFHALQVKKQIITTPRAVRDFFVKHGVDGKEFDGVFNSFAVDAKIRRAKELSRRYELSGVPTLIVNGQYVTDGPMAGGRKGMMEVLDYLIKKSSK